MHVVYLQIGRLHLAASCRCDGCLRVAKGAIGKHGVAALAVLSSETTHTLTNGLGDVQCTNAAPGTSSGSIKSDARSKKAILAQGPRTHYPPLPKHSLFYLPRPTVRTEIVDVQLASWASTTKGDVTGALRLHLSQRPGILGSQCAPAFENGGYLKDRSQKRSRTTTSNYGLEWFRKFHCECYGCPLKGTIGGLLDDPDSPATGDYAMHVYITGSCVHFNSQQKYGYGQLRGRARKALITDTRALMFNNNNLRASTTTMYEHALRDAPASGNRQHLGMSKCVVQSAFDQARDCTLDNDLRTSLSELERMCGTA